MELYNYNKNSHDLDNWFGIQSPTFILTTLSLYLLIVLKVGPNYMKDRKPFQLKTFIKIYNVTQVLACIWVVKEILNLRSTQVLHFWKCSVFAPQSHEEYLFNRLTYFVLWLKVVELSETVVFVLRKKQQQVSFLHVFHHFSTVTLVYLQLKYYRGGSASYPIFLNTNVHIVMYSYYLASATFDKSIVQQLQPIKKSITTIQMIQFVLILIQVGFMYTSCSVPPVLTVYYTIVVAVIFHGFYDFYKKSYTAKKLNAATKKNVLQLQSDKLTQNGGFKNGNLLNGNIHNGSLQNLKLLNGK